MIQLIDNELSSIKMRVYKNWDKPDIFYFHIQGKSAECGFEMSIKDTQKLIEFLEGKND